MPPLDLTVPDATPVLELLETFRRSKVMFAGVELGVFDALKSGPQSAAGLAKSMQGRFDQERIRCRGEFDARREVR